MAFFLHYAGRGARSLFFCLFIIQVAACARVQSVSSPGASSDDRLFVDDIAEPSPSIPDPLEPLNRIFFAFNDTVYYCFFKPVGQVYDAIVPDVIQSGIRNFFVNLLAPVRIVNNALQWKWKNVGQEAVRFVVNSTVGVLGLMDPAGEDMHLPLHTEDFGQTLGVLGVGPGFYIHWPLLGASSLRDSFGLWADSYVTPMWYLYRSDPDAWAGAAALSIVNDTLKTGSDYEAFKELSFDPYVAMRDAYEQYRRTSVVDEYSPDSPVGQGFVK